MNCCSFRTPASNFEILCASPFAQKLDVEPQNLSSSEGSTVDIRPPGDGVDSVELEPEESLDPEACFTEGERDMLVKGDIGWWELAILQKGSTLNSSTAHDLE